MASKLRSGMAGEFFVLHMLFRCEHYAGKEKRLDIHFRAKNGEHMGVSVRW